MMFAVWPYVIAHMKPNRDRSIFTVELNSQLMSVLIGEKEEEIEETIGKFCEPDVRSRTQDHEGRKLIKLGTFEYEVVNGAVYDQIRREVELREGNRARQKKHYQKIKTSDTASKNGSGVEKKVPAVPKIEGKPEIPSPPAGPTALDIYDAYPRKLDRKDALVAIGKALKKIDSTKLLELTKQYAAARQGQDDQFTPYPASWFNGERYNDDPAMWIPKPAVAAAATPGNTGPWAIQKVIDVKEGQATELFNRHATETGLDTTWDSQDARAQFQKIKGEVKLLKEKMTKLIPV